MDERGSGRLASEPPTSTSRTDPGDALRATTRLVDSLRDPARSPLGAAGIVVLETHVSYILLTGALAYKLKKPLGLGFLDFTTLERRRIACEDELRLNRRTAPELYRRVVAITGTPDAPRLDGPGEAIEYAVEMRQFDPEALFSTGLERGRISGEQVDALAERIADFHAGLAAAEGPMDGSASDPADDPADETVRKNLHEILALAPPPPLRARVEALAGWLEGELARVGPALAERRRKGFVRECHGDLHLANVALVDARPVLFDCLEFDLALRRIDVVDEIAFAFMDFRAHGRPDLGARFVSAYLERTGDYEGVVGLRLFAVHRALVRAKVALIRAAQPARGEATGARIDPAEDPAVERPLAVAEGLARGRPPRLVITCGLAGSGKTTVSSRLVERLEAIRVRSDVERKRMAGLAAADRSGSALGEGLYDPGASRRTYARLEALAEQMLASGWSVVVDAAFLTARERAPFRALARRGGFAFSTIVCEAPVEVLRRRVEARRAKGRDASEADRTVLDHQLTIHEPPTADERAETFTLSTDAPLAQVAAACDALGERLRAGDAGTN